MIPLTRHGWREMLIGSLVLILAAWGLGLIWRPLVVLALPFLVWLFAFFRDPNRLGPVDPKAVVSPADGKVSDITEIEHDELIDGPAVRVGIFLSVFNVHVNRSPCAGRVVAIEYKAGKFITPNAASFQAAERRFAQRADEQRERGGRQARLKLRE